MTQYLRHGSSELEKIELINSLVNYRLNATGSIARPREDKDAEVISVKDFGAIGNGIIDDSTAIQNALNAVSTGQKLIFPDGNYLIKSKITALLPRGVTIHCYGTLKFSGLSECLEIICLAAEIKINRILCADTCGTALIIKSCIRSRFDIREITGDTDITTAGIKVVGKQNTLDKDGTELDGVIYCDIDVKQIDVNRTTADCVVITTEPDGTTPGYVNENDFRLKWLNGNNAIKHVKGTSQTDRFNSNRFYTPGFENITTDGFIAVFCSRNFLISPRIENVGQYIVSEDTQSNRNHYYFSYAAQDTKLNFNGILANIYGQIIDSNGNTKCQMAWQDPTGEFLYFADRFNDYLENNTIYFKRQLGGEYFDQYIAAIKDSTGTTRNGGLLDPIGQQTITAGTGDITIQDDISVIRCSNNSGNMALVMPAHKEINGYSVILNLYFFNTANTFEIKKGSSGGVTLADGEINRRGTWLLTYESDAWKAVRLGNELLTSPSDYETSFTWDPGSIAAGAVTSSPAQAVTKASIGDSVTVYIPTDSSDTSGLFIQGKVTGTGVIVTAYNPGVGADNSLNGVSGNWTVRIDRKN